jgi:hypothetical protein
VPEQVAELVQTFQQAALVEGIDGEGDRLAAGQRYRLRGEVDGDFCLRRGFCQPGQLCGDFQLDYYGQQPVLQRIVAEDIGEGGANHGAEAMIQQRPGRVLARRAAAKVATHDQDLRAAIGRLVEHEARIGRALRGVAPAGKEPCA